MREKKKIFIMNHGLSSGGTDTFVCNVAKGLDKECYNVYIVMAVDDSGHLQFREQEVMNAGVHVLRTCDLSGVQDKLRHCVKLYQLLCTEKPNAFHTNMDLFNGINLFIAWLAHIPVRVCHSHTSGSQYETQTGRHFRVNIYRSLMRKMIWLFSTYRLGCSAAAMDYLYEEKWKNDINSQVMPNGIDLEQYKNAKSDMAAQGSGGFQGKTLLTVGRLSAVKNPQFMIEIMRKLKDCGDYRLIWVGDGELRDVIEDKIKEYNLEKHVYLVGAHRDVTAFYKGADILLFPSLFEGLGITVIEAQAAGLPCLVSTNVPREVNCGLCEFLGISEKDVDIWIDRIKRFDPKKFRLDQKKLEKYDIRYMIENLEKIYFSKNKQNYDKNSFFNS